MHDHIAQPWIAGDDICLAKNLNGSATSLYHIADMDIKNFDDRNLVNAKIHHLEEISDMLRYVSKLVYQTARGAKGMLKEILGNKRLSSYPAIQSKLTEAVRKALDSPQAFAVLCHQAANDIDFRVADLKEAREDFVHGGTPVQKGIVD